MARVYMLQVTEIKINPGHYLLCYIYYKVLNPDLQCTYVEHNLQTAMQYKYSQYDLQTAVQCKYVEQYLQAAMQCKYVGKSASLKVFLKVLLLRLCRNESLDFE